jgi:hypothetical protein
MPVSTEDYVAIADSLGRYCWLLDHGDEDGWIALWSEDGTLLGLGPQPIVGREALRHVPRKFAEYAGRRRHLAGNLFCDYGESRNAIDAKFYNFISGWSDTGGEASLFAICEATFVRVDSRWLISRSIMRLLGRPGRSEAG